ncbi:MAG: ATP-binding protein [Ardenticatenia bacterium]|nr:ATP-binding protein [Ardenticatenia bacterium]
MIGNFTFHPATKTRARARIAIIGPSGSGKTYSALAIAAGLGKRVAVIDTERGSASKYAGLPGMPAFDVLELESFAPETYVSAIGAAGAAGYDVLIIDSLSHAWMGKDGALEQVDRAAKRSQSGNSFAAWREITPKHNALVDAMLASSCHLIVTMRAKTEYVMETNSRGKQEPRKIGLAPIQRDGMEYEFDVVGDITLDHELIISKTRCPAFDGKVIQLPGLGFGQDIADWLSDGAPVPPPTFNGPGSFTEATDAEFTDAPAPEPEHVDVESWRELIEAQTSGAKVYKIFQRLDTEEPNLYRRAGADRIAAERFVDLMPASVTPSVAEKLAPILGAFAAALQSDLDDVAVPKTQRDEHGRVQALVDAALTRMMGLLPPDELETEAGVP